MTADPGARRLVLALLASCALHAALVISRLPHPGAGRDAGAGRVSVRLVEAPGIRSPDPAPRTIAPRPVPRVAPVEPERKNARSAAPTPSPAHEVVVDPATDTRGASGTVYLPSSSVDVRAVPIHDIAPEYPAEAGFTAGYLVLQIFVNELGTVDSVNVMVSDPEGVFDGAARRAFSTARFRPAVKDGATVKTEIVVEVKFEPPVLPVSAVPLPALPPQPPVPPQPPMPDMPR